MSPQDTIKIIKISSYSRNNRRLLRLTEEARGTRCEHPSQKAARRYYLKLSLKINRLRLQPAARRLLLPVPSSSHLSTTVHLNRTQAEVAQRLTTTWDLRRQPSCISRVSRRTRSKTGRSWKNIRIRSSNSTPSIIPARKISCKSSMSWDSIKTLMKISMHWLTIINLAIKWKTKREGWQINIFKWECLKTEEWPSKITKSQS